MEACNLCGGTRWETLEATGPTRVVRCACGLVFLAPQPPRPVLEKAYNEAYYEPWKKQLRLRERIWQKRIAQVETLVSPAGKLLDVGCGTGAFLLLARARGWHVTGTELSPHAVALAETRGLTVNKGEVWEAGFPAQTFDVVTCWHVIEHASDPRRLVEEIYQVLRPGGWLVLATPNLQDHFFRTAYLLARRHVPRLYEPDERELHLFHFSARTIAALLASSPFETITVGFDRGAAAVWGKLLVNELAYCWFRLTGLNWGMAIEVTARKPGTPTVKGKG